MTDLTLDTPLIRDPDLVAAPMDGELVMMSIDNGEYYGVGGVGPRIWELLEQPITLDALALVICNEFEVDEAQCRDDLSAFTQQLLDMGLVKPVEA